MSRFNVNPSVIAFGSVVVSFAAGAGAGYFLTKRHFETMIDDEVATFKADYAAQQDALKNSLVVAAKNEALKNEEVPKLVAENLVKELHYASTAIPDENKNVVTRVFDNAPAVPDWDEEAEEAFRLENSVFIITRDEFYLNATDFAQEQLTYYEEDDTLCNSRDDVITDVVPMVGVDCLNKFGYGSEDENTVYVRNENFNADYEIVRTNGKYSEIVLGLSDAELKHSSRPRKFRTLDD